MLICSSTSAIISIKFTPNGLEVIALAFLISCLKISQGIPPPAMIPRPPSLETCPARLPLAIHAIAPCMIGYLIPSSLQISLLLINPPKNINYSLNTFLNLSKISLTERISLIFHASLPAKNIPSS